MQQNEWFTDDPYEALQTQGLRIEHLEQQIASLFALMETHHNQLQVAHKRIAELSTLTLHHARTLKETTNG